jgi:CDP-6-deoxy-D-xylo-4-hexulose-3-dehydrase
MPVIQLGFVPVLIDIDPTTLNVSCSSVKAHEIECLFITHLLGFHGDIEEIAAYCKEKSIILLEDTCESLGTSCNGVRLGNFGLASSFSTFVGHHMSTIEGGMVTTNNKDLYDLMKVKRSHGMARESTKFKDYADLYPEIDKQFLFVTDGYNFRNHEICAVLGSSQLKRLDKMIEIRNRNHESFKNT